MIASRFPELLELLLGMIASHFLEQLPLRAAAPGCGVPWREGAWKKRVILDLKASSVTACTRATHRVVHPRVSDTVQDVLELLWDQAPGEEIEWAVLDFTDAF
jgi:hypothetical protein